MSATFTAPTTATSGLQNYDLQRGVLNLAPETAIRFTTRRLRFAAARRRRKLQSGPMQKDKTMDTITQMVGTLAKSVEGIIGAGGDDRDALLTQSFSEFGDAVRAEVAALRKAAPDSHVPGATEPLFKGLGTVGRVANLASRIAQDVENIRDGKEWKGQDDKAADGDKASPEVVELLEHALTYVELALRHSVNEHVDLADDGDEPDEHGMLPSGHHIMVVKSADGQEIAVKTALPNDLAKFATYPDQIDAALIDLACGELVKIGVAERDLLKVLQGDDPSLAKGVPGEQDPDGALDPDGQGGATDGDLSEQDPMEAMNLVGRLLAAAMIQLDGVMRMVEGEEGDTGGDGTGEDPDPMADTQPTAQQDAIPGNSDKKPITKSAPSGGSLAKLGRLPTAARSEDPRIDDLSKAVTEIASAVGGMRVQVEKALAQPSPPKGVLTTLAKRADGGAGDPEEGAQAYADDLAKMSREERAVALTKLTHQVGGQPEVLIKR